MSCRAFHIVAPQAISMRSQTRLAISTVIQCALIVIRWRERYWRRCERTAIQGV
jgi:hypothetical protein